MRKVRVIETFAGSGAARIGLGERDYAFVFANDWCPIKCESYRTNLGPIECCDIADLDPVYLPSADMVWASTPCPDFSSAGPRDGMDGKRAPALLGLFDLIRGMVEKPSMIVLENVMGMLTHNDGTAYRQLVEMFDALGYYANHAVLDAVDFLPQSRRRLFIVAVPKSSLFLVEHYLDGLPGIPARGWRIQKPPRRKVNLIDILEPQEVWDDHATMLRWITRMRSGDISKVINTLDDQKPLCGTMFNNTRGNGQTTEVRFDGNAGCLRVAKGGSSRQKLLIGESGEIRTRFFTNRELARLMGFPDEYVLPATTGKVCALTGDAVVVPVVTWLSETLLKPMLELLTPVERVKRTA